MEQDGPEREALLARARARWPALEVPRAEFLAFAAARLPPGGPAAARGEDLWLACACARGAPGALAAFRATYDRDLAAILARFGPSIAAEARQLLDQQLFVAEAGAAPKIAEYAGRGDLLAYLRVVAVRVALQLLRRERPDAMAGDDEPWEVPADQDDPELQYLKVLYRGEFKAAFTEALAGLPARARTLLRYHLVDGLSIDKLAAVYGEHRSTAARQLAKARAQLVADTRRALTRRLRVDRAELDSIMRLVQSSIDLSARRLLAE